jgi:hypothetical protein
LVLRIAGTVDTDSTAKGTLDIVIGGFNYFGKWTKKRDR